MEKIKNPDFSYWAWSTPWGHVLSLKSFCWNPVLSWAIRYSVFQLVKFFSSFEFICRTMFSNFDIWWSSLDIINDFLAIFRIAFFHFSEICEIKQSLFYVFQNFIFITFLIRNVISNKWKLRKLFFEKGKNNDFLFHRYFTETEIA